MKREVTPEFVNTSKEIFIPQIQGVTIKPLPDITNKKSHATPMDLSLIHI